MLGLAVLLSTASGISLGQPQTTSLIGAEARVFASTLPILPARGFFYSVDSAAVVLQLKPDYAEQLQIHGFRVHILSLQEHEIGSLASMRAALSEGEEPIVVELSPGQGDSRAAVRRTRLLFLKPEDVLSADVLRDRKSRVGRGALIGLCGGALVGAAIGYATYDEHRDCPPDEWCLRILDRDDTTLVGALAGAVVGLVVGGAIGAASPAERWEPVALQVSGDGAGY
ncbi:MAG: hypothetical protein ACE15D_10945 [Candidatus Eisenbacteria bacterium]